MASHKLEITLHSAKDLYDVKFFGTMDPYAVVWIAGDGKESQPRTTAVAKKGASSPIWNCPMQFNLAPMHNNYILFIEIKHDGKLFDREIGKVQVPFADLLAGNGSGEKLSYPVKTSSGEENGKIIVSHKFLKPIVGSDEKNGSGGSGGKVDGGGPRKKVEGKKRNGKKVEEKKKGGTLKKIAGNVATKVVTEAALLVGTVALAVGLDYALDETVQVEEEEEEEEEEEDGEQADDEEGEGEEDEDGYEEGNDEFEQEEEYI